MIYLINQIIVSILVATATGIVVGWWMRGLRSPQTTVNSLPMTSDPFEARARLEQCHRDNASLRRELKESEEQVVKLQALTGSNNQTDLVERLQDAEARAQALLQDLEWRDDTIAALEHELEQLRSKV